MDESKYDETYVRPVAHRSVPSHSHVHAAAQFKTAYSQTFRGAIEVITAGPTPEFGFPCAFSESGTNVLELKPPGGPIMCAPDVAAKLGGKFEEDYAKYLKSIAEFFGHPATQVFPIQWKALAPFVGTIDYPNGTLPYPPASGYQVQIIQLSDRLKEAIARAKKEMRRKRK